ncbi:MAG: zinc-binding dehydrogenase, partial [Candidatus Nanopelagicales bacterium]
VIGMQGGVRAEVDLGVMLRRNLTLHTTSLRARSPEQKAYICAETERMVWPWISAGIVRPVVDRTYEMVDAAHAHRALEDGGITGKILLTR